MNYNILVLDIQRVPIAQPWDTSKWHIALLLSSSSKKIEAHVKMVSIYQNFSLIWTTTQVGFILDRSSGLVGVSRNENSSREWD